MHTTSGIRLRAGGAVVVVASVVVAAAVVVVASVVGGAAVVVVASVVVAASEVLVVSDDSEIPLVPQLEAIMTAARAASVLRIRVVPPGSPGQLPTWVRTAAPPSHDDS